MKLTIRQVLDAVQALDAVIRERRPMPQLGKFRMARMHAKLMAEFIPANAQRDELITKHGDARDDGTFWVPPERMAEFNADWNPLADHEVEIEGEPLRMADLVADASSNGALEVGEILLLGDLVAE